MLRFRDQLEAHEIAPQILSTDNAQLIQRGLLPKTGAVVCAILMAAPSSTKNRTEHDPEMHQTKKGNQWHFGMKAHRGVNGESGLVQAATVCISTAKAQVQTETF